MGRNFDFVEILKVGFKWWERDYVIVLWVLIVEL